MSKIGAPMIFALGALLAAAPAVAAELLSAEQQVKLGQIITDQNKAAPWTGGFALARDATVPADVKLETLPEAAQQTAPQLRGFGYLVVEEQIALVEPQSRKIVEVIPRWRK